MSGLPDDLLPLVGLTAAAGGVARVVASDPSELVLVITSNQLTVDVCWEAVPDGWVMAYCAAGRDDLSLGEVAQLLSPGGVRC